jgi:hypothetical protein
MKLNITALATLLTPFKDQMEDRFGPVTEVLFYRHDQCQLIWNQYDAREEGSKFEDHSHWLVIEYKSRYIGVPKELSCTSVSIRNRSRSTLYNDHQSDPEDILDMWTQLVEASKTFDEEFFNTRLAQLAKEAYQSYITRCRAGNS